MNREIKFRFWSKDGRMLDDHDGWVENIGINEAIFCSQDYGYVVMQFTGLYDKKDREIYEGDVVKCEGGTLPAEVVWFNGAWCLDTHDESTRNNPLEMYYFSDCEVIGNIYQNPELLQK